MNTPIIEDSTPLFETTFRLLKSATTAAENDNPKFGGIASSEGTDEDGDAILRKHLDITYISKRGYVNWDHSRSPENQLGFITKAVIIKPDEINMYEDLLETPLTKSASLYVEGSLYKNSSKAMDVHRLLTSIPKGVDGSLGLSVEGGVLRKDGGIQMALIRGVAITPTPAQPDTLCRLMKSLSLDVSTSVESEMVIEAINKGLSESEAVVRVMELRPNLPLELAKKIVKYVFNKVNLGGN